MKTAKVCKHLFIVLTDPAQVLEFTGRRSLLAGVEKSARLTGLGRRANLQRFHFGSRSKPCSR